MVKSNILVVDSDEGFGFMLKGGLDGSGHYNAVWLETGSEALQAIVEQNFDLVIIDVGLVDMAPSLLVKAIRDAKPGIKIMMIPMMGHDLAADLKSLNINGILPKPFFVGDLPDLVEQAIGKPRPRTATASFPVVQISGDTSAAEKESMVDEALESIVGEHGPVLNIPLVPQETIRFLRANETEILRLLNDLNLEVRAEAILLIAGIELVSNAGMLSHDQCEELTLLVAQSSQAAAEAATYLGEKSGRFMQSLHEGGSYRLYTLTLSEGILLSLALSTNVPLGMIRHQSRQVAEQLSKFII